MFILTTSIAFSQESAKPAKEQKTPAPAPPPTPEPPRNNPSDNRNIPSERQNNSNSNSGSFNNFWKEVFVDIIINGIWIVTFGIPSLEEHLHNRLTQYPYVDDISGNYENSFKNKNRIEQFSEIKKMRFDLDNSILYSSSQNFSNNFRAKLRFAKFAQFHVSFLSQIEHTKDWVRDFKLLNVNYMHDRLRFNKFNLGWEFGFSYNQLNGASNMGLNFGLNAEYFFKKPFSIFTTYKINGFSKYGVGHFELQGKYHIKRSYFSLGYQLIHIDTAVHHFGGIGAGVYL
ncbi:MAG: hypothetical protein WAS72_07605 [Saprospiraceae bacterium]